ncbi:TetR family transcriptional regulator [Tomitella fengzijianii]|nr:TetR family transcriptional regulator [Tomitella fengzijianii]
MSKPVTGADGGAEWTTPEVAEFMGISRQAINRRVHSRKLIGYLERGVTRFPRWQFDMANRSVHPEVEELLAALDADIPLADTARWATLRVAGMDATPAELLLIPACKDTALDLARRYRPGDDGDGAGAASAVQSSEGVYNWLPTTVRDGAVDPRNAILRAAAELFARRGPAKVSLREVAAAADVPYSLIYRFYRTKENLLVSVMTLFVNYGGERITGMEGPYEALDLSFAADSGQFGRMLTWAIFDGAKPERLFGDGIEAFGYRKHIEDLWDDPRPPGVRHDFDPRLLASLIALVSLGWDFYGPYLTTLAGLGDRDDDDLRDEVIDLLKVLMYAARPRD